MSRTSRPPRPGSKRMATSSAVVNAGAPTLQRRSRGRSDSAPSAGLELIRSIGQHHCRRLWNENRIPASAPKHGYRRASCRRRLARGRWLQIRDRGPHAVPLWPQRRLGVGAEGQIVAPGSNSTGRVTHSGGQAAFLPQVCGEICSIGIPPASNRPQRAPRIALGFPQPGQRPVQTHSPMVCLAARDEGVQTLDQLAAGRAAAPARPAKPPAWPNRWRRMMRSDPSHRAPRPEAGRAPARSGECHPAPAASARRRRRE